MHRVIYVSRAAENMNFASLSQIATTAQRYNERDNLSGVLLWVEGMFLQLIEGPKENLHNTLVRIQNDSRHSGLLRLSYRPTYEVICTDWTMGCYSAKASALPFGLAHAESLSTRIQRIHATPDKQLERFFRQFYCGDFKHAEPIAA